MGNRSSNRVKKVEDYTEEDKRAVRDLEKAIESIRKGAGGKAGESLEAKYAEAYQKCYRLGLKQYKLEWCKTTR